MTQQTRYDRIGISYDTTRRADPFLTQGLIHLLNASGDRAVLDIACGSGNYTVALAACGLNMTGIDQSGTMLAAARKKTGGICWVVGDASMLPFAHATFDGAICTLAIHHFADLNSALREARRVLRGGRLVIFTATHRQMRGYWLSAYFPQALARSIAQMPDLPVVQSALQAARFGAIRAEPYEIQRDLQDFFLYSGKHRPAMYLDPRVRAGISTFALLADAAEVDAGCRRLAEDIGSGRIDDVMASYVHGDGDYLFVIAEA